MNGDRKRAYERKNGKEKKRKRESDRERCKCQAVIRALSINLGFTVDQQTSSPLGTERHTVHIQNIQPKTMFSLEKELYAYYIDR